LTSQKIPWLITQCQWESNIWVEANFCCFCF